MCFWSGLNGKLTCFVSESVFDNFVKVMGVGYVFEKVCKCNIPSMSVYFVFFVCCFGTVGKNGLCLPL